jgi:hypothetical protein
MVVGMAVNVEGRPICCEMWPGNTIDVTTLPPIVKRMRERFRLRQITVVADRGIVSQATLNAFLGSDPPVRYIVRVRMRRQKEVRLSVLGSRRACSRAFRNASKPRIQRRSKSRRAYPDGPTTFRTHEMSWASPLFNHVSSKTHKRIQLTVHEQVAQYLL